MFNEITRANNLLSRDIRVSSFLMLFPGVFVLSVLNAKCPLLELKITDSLKSILVIIVGVFEDVCPILSWLVLMVNKLSAAIRKKHVVKSVQMFSLIKQSVFLNLIHKPQNDNITCEHRKLNSIEIKSDETIRNYYCQKLV